MAYLTKADFSAHIYPEIIDVITRTNDAIIDKVINNAIAEAKGYLNRFDLLKLFGNDTTPATINDDHLKEVIMDIACWKLCKLANPNINLELFRTAYQDAIDWLVKIQKGMVDPEGWIYKTDDPTTEVNEATNVQWSSNPKQYHHF